MSSELAKLRDYSSLFSRKHGVSWLKGNFNSVRSRIELYDQSMKENNGATYLDYLKKIYKVIEVNYPNEYVIKNSFINHSLIDEIKDSDSVICSEFRVGRSVVDLAMFNGVSKAFEIKSEFDTSKRLANQLEDYKKIFNEVYIIVPKSKIDYYSNFDKSTGIIAFQSIKNQRFELFRKPITNKVLDSDELINVLRSNEYKDIVNIFYGSLPEMTSFTQYDICKELFSKIPIEKLNKIFLDVIKGRKENTYLSKNHHREFNQLSLAMKFNQSDHRKIVANLKETIKF